MWLCSLCLTVLVIAGTITAYPSGAPNEVCDSLAPRTDKEYHDALPQEPNTFPYTVGCIRAGPKSVIVEISGDNYKGLIVQLRNGKDEAVGTFESVPNGHHTVCSDQAITHDNADNKNGGMFEIEISDTDMTKDLKCVVSIVKEKQMYWVAHSVQLKDIEKKPAVLPKKVPTSPAAKTKTKKGMKESKPAKFKKPQVKAKPGKPRQSGKKMKPTRKPGSRAGGKKRPSTRRAPRPKKRKMKPKKTRGKPKNKRRRKVTKRKQRKSR